MPFSETDRKQILEHIRDLQSALTLIARMAMDRSIILSPDAYDEVRNKLNPSCIVIEEDGREILYPCALRRRIESQF